MALDVDKLSKTPQTLTTTTVKKSNGSLLIKNAIEETPSLVEAEALSETTANLVNNAKEQTPTLVYAEDLPNKIHKSGVLLTETVLTILCSSIMILLAYSGFSDYRIYNFQEKSHDDIFAEIHGLYANNINREALDEAIQELESIKAKSISESKKTNLHKELNHSLSVLEEIEFRREKIDGQKWKSLADSLRTIADTPSKLTSGNGLDKPINALKSIKIISLSNQDRNEIIKTLHELQKDYQEANRSHRDFVVQISQMVLLNLLLPVLTALLGYVFGSRSEQQNNKGGG
jgi:hypothetical protein